MPFPADQSRDSTSPEHMQLRAGQVVFNRRYELRERLGSGGMGVVWLAFDQNEKAEVALKFLPTILVHQDKEMDRLREEVRAGKELRHPLIVATYGMEMDGSLAAIVLEYVSGQTLKQKLETHAQGFFEPAEIEPWLRDIVSALTYLHEDKKRLHRDLKPANIIIDAEGRARLMDFGISQRLKDTMGRHSQTGQAHGTSNTLAYASPESLGLRHRPAVSDDIYSLGATLYELFTGTPPFYQGGPEVLALHIKTETAPSIAQRRADLVEDGMNNTPGLPVPGAWQQAIAICLAKDRAQRPASAEAVQAICRKEQASVPQDSTDFKLVEAPQTPAAAIEPAPPILVPSPYKSPELKLKSTLPKSPPSPVKPSVSVAPPMPESNGAPVMTFRQAWRRRGRAEQITIWLFMSCGAFVLVTSMYFETKDPSGWLFGLSAVFLASLLLSIRRSPDAAGEPKPVKTSFTQAPIAPFTTAGNSLGMKFVHFANMGTNQKVLGCIHETRSKDFAAFMTNKGRGYEMTGDCADAWRTYKYKGVPVGRGKNERAECSSHPVCCVSHEDAKAFCAWLTKKEGREGLIGPNDEYRLPTDHEWNLMVGIGGREDAQATPESKNGKLAGVYPWGSWPDTTKPPPKGAGNYGDEAAKKAFGEAWGAIPGYDDDYATTAPVMSFPPNSQGFYDLGGNAWEWCEDWYNEKHEDRVLRGGSWYNSTPTYLLSSYRLNARPTRRSGNIGFRVVVVVSGD